MRHSVLIELPLGKHTTIERLKEFDTHSAASSTRHVCRHCRSFKSRILTGSETSSQTLIWNNTPHRTWLGRHRVAARNITMFFWRDPVLRDGALTKSISQPSLPEWDDASSARHGTIGNVSAAETQAFTERDGRLLGLSRGKVRCIPSASKSVRWMAERRRCRSRLPHGCHPRLQLSERAPPRAGRAIHAQSHSQKNG